MPKESKNIVSRRDTVKVSTTRFGVLNIASDRVIELVKPVLGFESHKRFVLVESEQMTPFIWLQALDEPGLAFLLINPILFFADYSIEVNPKEVEDIGVVDGSEVETYVIVTVPGDPRKMTANLQGPIVINSFSKQAKQLALVNARYSVSQALFAEGTFAGCDEEAPARRETVSV